MAPVGRSPQNGKGVGVTEGSAESRRSIDEDPSDSEVKEEPPENDDPHEGKLVIKLEDEDDDIHKEELDAFMAMNDDEGFLIKTEESDEGTSDLEDKKPEILYETTCKSEKDGDNNKESSLSPTDIVDDSNKALMCKVCGKQFTRLFYFNQHIKTHKVSAISCVTKKPFKCQECGKTFAQLQHLTGHSRIHIASKYYECPICKRKFTELSNLTMHLLKTHPDEKPYKCSECEKQFTQSSALKKHLRTHSRTTSQEDLDRIDSLFFIGDGTEKDMEEPSRKKIKLEKDEDKSLLSTEKTSPAREKLTPLKEEKSIVTKAKSPGKEKTLLLKERCPPPKGTSSKKEDISLEVHRDTQIAGMSSLGKTSAAAKLNTPFIKEIMTQSKVNANASRTTKVEIPVRKEMRALNNETSEAVKIENPEQAETQAPSKQLSSASTKASHISSPMKLPVSPVQELSPSTISIKTNAPLSQVLTSAASSKGHNSTLTNTVHQPAKVSIISSEDKPDKEVPGESSVDPTTEIHSIDPLPLWKDPPLRNGVPLDQVKCPQIKITKYTKIPGEMDSNSTKMPGSGSSPLKSALSNNMVNNIDSQEGKLQTSNQLTICNGDRKSKSRPTILMNKTESREPFPSLEEPEGDHEVLFKCHRCEVFLDSEEKLHNHLMDHTGVKLFECRFCGKDFTKMSSLKKHLYLHATGAIPQDCTRCGKSYTSFRELKDHAGMNKCNPSGAARFKCFRCRKFISSLKRLKVHLLSQCNEEPVKYYIPKKHDLNGSGSNGSIPASEANGSLENVADSANLSSKNEWITQKFEKATPKDALILSDMRGLTFESNDIEALQILTESSSSDQEKEKECWKLQCQSCEQKFESTSEANTHSKAGCSTRTTVNSAEDKESLRIRVVFEEDDKSLCSLTCSECHKTVTGVEKMLLHIKEHIFERNTFYCPVLKCGKLFKDPKEFKLHLKAHTGHKPYKCADCGKRFFLRENYETHANRHGIMKNWNSLNTIIGENIKQSKNTSSPAKSPSTIESTIANFEVSETDVDKKMKWTPHHSSQPVSDRSEFQPLQNQIEEKPFLETNSYPKIAPASSRPIHTSVVSLSVSQGSFTVAAPRPYSVSSPGSSKSGYSTASSKQSFKAMDPSARLQYYRITENSRASISKVNEELRKYPRSGRCDVCKKFCSRLDKHMMVHLNQKPHLCPVCPQAFRQSEHLRRHIRARHEGNHRQFECPQCHKRLTRKDKLKEHMKNCCKIMTRTTGQTFDDSLFEFLPGPVIQSPPDGRQVITL